MNLQIKTFKKENIFTILLLIIIFFSIGLKQFKPDIFNNDGTEELYGFRIVLNSNLLCKDGKVNIFAENKSTNRYKMRIKIYDNWGNLLAESKVKIGKKLNYLKLNKELEVGIHKANILIDAIDKNNNILFSVARKAKINNIPKG
ncbi:MAG: hypothetical protein IJC97_03260 [Oscillospiraceae bacterium]|nr:hypothetical protein [Oscillospiraceae bacterium]